MSGSSDPIALYVHWPFCVSKCPYCDFNSHVVDTVDHGLWRDALLTELATAARGTEGRPLAAIFFGGGTPSLMDADTVAAVIATARAVWPAADDCEITLEANPGTVDADRFAAFRAAGVNRLSLGVQSLDDTVLAFLGRRHSAAEAARAIVLAGETFDRLSFDLIYARPGQTEDQWRGELGHALDLLRSAGGGHLSCYQLTIEPATPFATDVRKGLFRIPDDDDGAALYDVTADVLEAAGLPAYEVSNHARTDDACRHNVHVWRGGDYVGIGPGAHGRVTVNGATRATARLKPPAQWLKRVGAEGAGSQSDTTLTPRERAEEMIMMGLRLAEGLDLDAVATLTGIVPHEIMSPDSLELLESEGLIRVGRGRIAATPRGLLVLNAVTGALLS